jgi:hypothetical protein
VLKGMTKDVFLLDEKDTEMLAYSLLSIAASGSKEGIKAKRKAKKLSADMNTFLERRAWLHLPKMAL